MSDNEMKVISGAMTAMLEDIQVARRVLIDAVKNATSAPLTGKMVVHLTGAEAIAIRSHLFAATCHHETAMRNLKVIQPSLF